MANWYGIWRTNYFHVRDEVVFTDWAATVPYIELITDSEGRFGSLGNGEGGVPSYRHDDDSEFDFVEELGKQLAENEVAIVMCVGREKMRYLTGYAEAVHSDGRRMFVDVQDIYNRVKNTWGVTPTPAEY